MKKELEMNVSLIYGSVRSDRQGINAARYLERKLHERNIGISLIDPLEFRLPLLDKMYKQFKPSAIASYSAGRYGGVRAAVHLRVIAGELGMPSISSMLSFPQVGKFFDKNLAPVNSKAEGTPY